MRWLSVIFILCGLCASACKPDLGAPQSLVTAPRVLAVRGNPAEADPGAAVAYDTLAVDPSGTVATPQVTWGLCHTPKPPAEANAVSVDCLGALDETGPAPTFSSPMPTDACTLFGPIAPPPMMGQPPIRPRDPDVTGGFYQPVRAVLADAGTTDIAFALERIRCRLTNAPSNVTSTFNMTYTPNVNPTLAQVTLDPDGQALVLYAPGASPPAAPASIAPGTRVTFEAAWPEDTPEKYPVWNLATRTLEPDHREALRVSWFASDGSFEHDRTGRGEVETELFTRNDWTAPTDAQVVHFWVVLRDSRGGTDFGSYDLAIGP
jgi:hypothetical protein